MSFILVRHALTIVDPARPNDRWVLDPTGLDDAEAMLGSLPPGDVVSSDEGKATATATLIGRPFATDARLREVRRPFVGDQAGYAAMARRYVAGEPLDGWEPIEKVRSRMTAAIEAREQPFVVVTHGLAMTAYVASVADIDAPTFWSGLTFPDVWHVENPGSLNPRRRMWRLAFEEREG